MLHIPLRLKQSYLKNRVRDLEILTESFSKNAIEDFNRVGHQLAGSARNYGFADLESIAEQMEDLSAETFQTTGRVLLNRFRDWLSRHLASSLV